MSIRRTFSINIRLFRRFVDDILVFYEHGNSCTLETLLITFNSWHPSVVVTHDTSEVNGLETSFLDLNIKLQGSRVHYSTFRKPMNTYSYLPRSSNHSPNVFTAIIHTELYMLLVTNKFECDFLHEVDFFRGKIVARGYERARFETVAEKYSWDAKADVLNKKQGIEKQLVPPKVAFFSGFESVGLSRLVHNFRARLHECTATRIHPVVCNVTSPNLFRLRYARFL